MLEIQGLPPAGYKHPLAVETRSPLKLLCLNIAKLVRAVFSFLKNIVVSGVRCIRSCFSVKKKLIGLQVLKSLIEAIPTNGKIILKDLLSEGGYSNKISDLTFMENSIDFSKIDLTGVVFSKCDFEWVLFGEAQIRDSKFLHCNFQHAYFGKSTIENSTFEKCEIVSCMFSFSNLQRVTFNASSIVYSSFEGAQISDSKINHCCLKGTHFFDSTIKETQINISNLEETIFFESKNFFTIDEVSNLTHVISKPVIALIRPSKKRGVSLPRVYQKLIASGSTPLLFSAYAENIDLSILRQEVQSSFNAFNPNTEISLPIYHIQRALNTSDIETSSTIFKRVASMARHVNGFLLPGGEDISSEWYGEESQSLDEESLSRSVLEFSLMTVARERGIPLMGICKGHEALGIFHGGKLKEVHGFEDVTQEIDLHQYKTFGLMAGIFKKENANIRSVVSYHFGLIEPLPEAMNSIGDLEVVSSISGIVNAMEPKLGGSSPVISIQFHPEFRIQAPVADSVKRAFLDSYLAVAMNPENDRFWDVWAQVTSVHQNKQALMQRIRARVIPLVTQ